MTRSISTAGLGLLSTPCSDCGAGSGEWCRRRDENVNQQHDGRYTAWRQAGRPVIGADGVVVTDPVVTS